MYKTLNIAIQKALLKPEIKSKLDEVEQLMKNEIRYWWCNSF